MPAGAAIAMYDRLVFTARADKPMRVSVQLRASQGEGERWHRSVYLDSDAEDRRPGVCGLPAARHGRPARNR
jgi:hypothetical protein